MSKKKNKRLLANRIKAGKPSGGSIPEQSQQDYEECVVFSFKHVDHSNPKFSLQDVTGGYPAALAERLKAVCQMSLNEFTNPPGNKKSLRSHRLLFEKTSEKQGFPLNNRQWEQCPWQFQISGNEYGRVHGFLIRNLFYVVWFDPCHNLYS